MKKGIFFFTWKEWCVTIGTLQRGTFIHFLLTVESSVSWWTLTYVIMPVIPLSALATMKAGCICTGQHLVFTVCSFKPLWAHTLIAILRVLQGKRYKVYLKAPCQMFSYHILFTAAPTNPIILILNSIYSTQSVNWVTTDLTIDSVLLD